MWTNQLNSYHMDKIYDLFMNFLKHQSGNCLAVNGGTEIIQISLNQKIFICAPKINLSVNLRV